MHALVPLVRHWLPDAAAHRNEIARFAEQVDGDGISFRARTYQEAYAALLESDEPIRGWHEYMGARYFNETEAVR